MRDLRRQIIEERLDDAPGDVCKPERARRVEEYAVKVAQIAEANGTTVGRLYAESAVLPGAALFGESANQCSTPVEQESDVTAVVKLKDFRPQDRERVRAMLPAAAVEHKAVTTVPPAVTTVPQKNPRTYVDSSAASNGRPNVPRPSARSIVEAELRNGPTTANVLARAVALATGASLETARKRVSVTMQNLKQLGRIQALLESLGEA